MADQLSGITRTDNLSGGVNRSATPNTIPGISFSDIANFDIDNSSIVTRRGLNKSGIAQRPGCLQFGFSDTQRVHYIRSYEASYMPATATTRQTNCFFYAKDLTATTETRYLLTFGASERVMDSLAEVYWDTDDLMTFRFRETTSDGWNTIKGTTTRAAETNYLFGIRLERSGTTTTSKLYDHSGLVASTIVTTATTFTAWSSLMLGNDYDDTYPGVNWSNAGNNALYGYVGEVAITKNVSPTATTFATNFQVLPPVYNTQDDNKVAYYPLRSDYDDDWGLQPSFSPSKIYRSGAGLTHYLVNDDNIPGLSKNPLYCTKSIHVDRLKAKRALSGQSLYNVGVDQLGDAYSDALNGVDGSYTLTMDMLSIRSDGTTENTPVFGGNKGPQVSLNDSDTPGFTRMIYQHKFNGAVSTTISTLIENKKNTSISFEYVHSSSSNQFDMKIYKDRSLVKESTTSTVGSTTPDAVLLLLLNTDSGNNNASQNVDYYMSGMLLHNAAVGTSWSEKPSEKITNTTIYETSRIRTVQAFSDRDPEGPGFGGNSGYASYEEITTATNTIEDTGQTISFFSVFDLPKRDNVIGGWLFNEVTGFDTATTLSPHGIIRNIFSTSTTDNSDIFLRYNSTPIWYADRLPLVSSGFLDDVYDQSPDRLAGFTPNDSTARDSLMIRNNTLTSYTGTTHVPADTYRYTSRLDTQLRSFNYGQSMYLHGQDYKLRYNGSAMIPVDSPSATIPLQLTASTLPSGLNGYYLYAYTFVDKNGIESYPCLTVGTTVSTGKVTVTSNLAIYDQSWINETVSKVRYYRSKGTTTNTTSLTIDASPELYLLREQSLETVKDNIGSTFFEDTAADDYLGAGPPYPGYADIMPSCKNAAIYNDTAYFTGNTFEPTMVYKALPEKPFLITEADEFRTEDGESNTGIASVGGGVIVFKRSSRKYYHRGMGTESPYEYANGGCIANDSLVSMGSEVMGLSEGGFFKTDGHRYMDLSTIIDGGRAVSSIQYDLDSMTEATMRAATAVYHEPTSRYLCKLDNKLYVFENKRKRWLIYKDVLGDLLVRDGILYMYIGGRFYKEVSNVSYVGTGSYVGSFTSGGLGYVTVTGTKPSSDVEGLPIYIDKTYYSITRIDGNNVYFDSNDTFTTGDYAIGVIRHYADTKFFDERTPGRNKWFAGMMTLEHSNTTGGTINLRTARNNGSFDDSYDHFEFDTGEDKGTCILRMRSKNIALKFEVMDGKDHEIRSYSFPYKQDSIL